MTGDESFLLDESFVLEFLTDCEVPVESTATTTDVSATGACDVISWQEKGEVASAKETTQWKKMSLAATDSTSSGNSSTTSKTAEIALRKRSWRQERKVEMLQLRELVKQLSAQLEELKKTAVFERLYDTKATDKDLAAVDQAAPAEPGHDKRIELCKRLRLDCRQADRPSNNEDIFRQLIAEVDESYATLGSVFVKVKMQELPCPGRRNLTSSCRTAGVFAEFVDCHVLPFDARQTGRLLWRLLATNEFKGPDAIFEDHFPMSDSTDLECCCVAVNAGDVNIRLMMRMATRIYWEQDRIVFIVHTLIEPIDVGTVAPLREILRLVVTPGNSSAGESTVMLSHRRITAHREEQLVQIGTELGTAASQWDYAISNFNQRVEDALVQDKHACQ